MHAALKGATSIRVGDVWLTGLSSWPATAVASNEEARRPMRQLPLFLNGLPAQPHPDMARLLAALDFLPHAVEMINALVGVGI